MFCRARKRFLAIFGALALVNSVWATIAMGVPSAPTQTVVPAASAQPAQAPTAQSVTTTETASTTSTATGAIANQERSRQIKQRIDEFASQIGVITEQYNGASLEVTKTAERLQQVKKRLYWFESELQAQRQQVNSKVVSIYKEGQTNPIEVIVSSSSFRDFLVKFDSLMKLGTSDATLLDKIHLQKRKIEEARSELEKTKEQQTKIANDLQNKKNEVLTKLQQYQAMLNGIDQQTRVYFGEMSAQEATEQANLRTRFASAAAQPNSVVALAMQFLGMPYVWAGERPETSFDCSGLTRYVYLQFGIDLPHWVPSQWALGKPVKRGDEQPGDLVFFHDLGHVGMYIGDGYFIEAPHTGDYIKISELAKRTTYMGAKRYLVNVPSAQ